MSIFIETSPENDIITVGKTKYSREVLETFDAPTDKFYKFSRNLSGAVAVRAFYTCAAVLRELSSGEQDAEMREKLMELAEELETRNS